jgi:hypothetical protein
MKEAPSWRTVVIAPQGTAVDAMNYGLPSVGHGISEIFNQQITANDEAAYILNHRNTG